MGTIRVPQNQPITLTCIAKNEDGSRMDLTGKAVSAKMRNRRRKIDFNPNITNAAQGEFQLTIDEATMLTVSPGRQIADIDIRDGGGVISSTAFSLRVRREA